MSTTYFVLDSTIHLENLKQEFDNFPDLKLTIVNSILVYIHYGTNQFELIFDETGVIRSGTRYGNNDETEILKLLSDSFSINFISEYEIDTYNTERNKKNLIVFFRDEEEMHAGIAYAEHSGFKPILRKSESALNDPDFLNDLIWSDVYSETCACFSWWLADGSTHLTNADFLEFCEEYQIAVHKS